MRHLRLDITSLVTGEEFFVQTKASNKFDRECQSWKKNSCFIRAHEFEPEM